MYGWNTKQPRYGLTTVPLLPLSIAVQSKSTERDRAKCEPQNLLRKTKSLSTQIWNFRKISKCQAQPSICTSKKHQKHVHEHISSRRVASCTCDHMHHGFWTAVSAPILKIQSHHLIVLWSTVRVRDGLLLVGKRVLLGFHNGCGTMWFCTFYVENHITSCQFWAPSRNK